MNVLPEPSQWFVDHFGDHSQRVMLALASAGRLAHERSLDAKAGSQLTTNEAYGSFWVSLPEEVVAQLEFLPDVKWSVPLAAVTTFPSCSTARLSFLPSAGEGHPAPIESDWGSRSSAVGCSPWRARLPSPSRSNSISISSFEGDLGSAIGDGSFGSATRVSLVAYDCSAQGGLQHVYVGEATLDSSGLVTWHHREELPLVLLNGEGAALAGLGDHRATRFDDAPLPESTLTLRGPGESEDVATDHQGTADTRTGGEPDGRP